jgi:5-(aminomethyl)-3-furanmethanol phosphate kinase
MNATMLKVGGSLAIFPQKLRGLCQILSEVSEKYPLIVLPGGGEFADTVRTLDERFKLSCWVSHRMSILGQDQYGFLLKDLISNAVEVSTFEENQRALDCKKLPVFLPSKLFFSEDPLENSWNVTSDSIAAYIAGRMDISKVLFVTDVDGIYTENPKNQTDARLLQEVTIQELMARKERTSVDKFLPTLLIKRPLESFVVNGLFPERVVALIVGKEAVCTKIRV